MAGRGGHVEPSFVSQCKDKILEYWDDTLKCLNNRFLEFWHLDSPDMHVARSESVEIPSCQNHRGVGQRTLGEDCWSLGLRDREDQTSRSHLWDPAPQS